MITSANKDPFEVAWWTLAMVVRWIISRDADEVADTMRSRKSLMMMGLECAEDIWLNPEAPRKSASQELWLKLGQGKLKACGHNIEGKLAPIDAPEWSHLTLAMDAAGRDYLIDGEYPLSVAYRRVVVESKSVQSLWPPAQQSRSETARIPSKPGKNKVDAAAEALAILYPKGLPAGLIAKDRLDALNETLTSMGRSKVSESTVLRALRRR